MWQQKMNSKPLWDWNIISCYPYISLPILASCGSCVAPFLLSPKESNMILSGRRYKRVSSNYCIKHYKTLCPFLFITDLFPSHWIPTRTDDQARRIPFRLQKMVIPSRHQTPPIFVIFSPVFFVISWSSFEKKATWLCPKKLLREPFSSENLHGHNHTLVTIVGDISH